MSDFSTVKPAFRLGPSQQIASDTTVVGYQEVSPKVVPGFNQPIKTHQVWASILWPFETTDTNISVNHSGLMVFDPLQIILSPDGFSLSYIDLTVSSGVLIAYTLGSSPMETLYTPGSDGQNMTLHGSDPKGLWEGFLSPFPFGAADIKISVPGLTSPQSLVESYGDWHVTAVLGNASDPVSDGHYLRMTMAQGSPYIYCEKKGLSDYINIQTVTGSKLWYENKNMAVFTLPNDNKTYAVFGPAGSQFNYSFTDSVNRLLSGSISLHFSDNGAAQFFSVAVLPYQLIGNLIHARPEVGFANNLQSDGLTLFEIPFYIPGSNAASITTNLKNMFFGQFGGIIKGVLSDAVTFPGPLTVSDYKAFYNFTVPSSPNHPLFQAIQLFEQHAFAFPVDTKIDWEYNQSDAQVCSTYNITTSLKYAGPGVTVSHYSSDTLVALKPHQYKYLKNSDYLLGPNHVYTSARGELHLMQGRSFETIYDYTGFVPSFPDVFSSSEKNQLKTYFGLISDSFIAGNPALENPPAAIDAAQGTYATGKVLGRFAQMMPALTMTNQSDLKAEIIGYMRAVLSNWFDPTDEIIDIEPATPSGKLNDAIQSLQSASDASVRYFYYDQKWNTLIGYPADFGAGMELNDHHFHYGYFIHAMAYILLYGNASDQAWAWSHKPIVDMMIKDCANWDRSDSMFPFLRFFNAFNGHFYASGWALGSGNQESTAEAMNFAAGTLLWGYVTDDAAIKDLGIFLYTSQKITLQEYWFDIHQTNFPKDIFFEDTSNHIVNRYNYNRQIVSVLKSAGGEFATFFGAQPVFIYGIQYLPITHASVYLGLMPQKLLAIDNDLLPATQNFLNQGIAYDSSNPSATINFSANYKMWDWADIFAEVRALYSPGQAATDLAAMGLYKTELVIPSDFNADILAASAPNQPLVLALDPPFGDTPLGEAGESKAHTYYWIRGLKHLGVLQTELVANIEMAVAFGPTQGDPENFLIYQHTTNSRIVTFRNQSSGQQYCFPISDGKKLYHFKPGDALSDCTTICPNEILPDDFTITQGQIVTLGESAASNALYLWTQGNYFLGSISDFPVQVQPLVTTIYTLQVLSSTNANCVTYATTTIYVTPPSAPISQLSAPQVVCFSDVITINFQVSDGDSLPVHYKLSGGLQSDFIGLGTTNVPISVARQAANFQTNLNYTLFVLVSDVVPQSDQRSFSVFVRNCSDSDTFVCPSVSLGSDPVINRGAQVTLGDQAVSDVLYTWYLDPEHNVFISSDFPLTVRPMATTTYHVVSQSTVRPYCNDIDSITVHVKPCQLQIAGLTYPATICKSDLITIDFKVNGNNLYTNQIGYTVVGDGVSDVSGFSTIGSLISVTRQAPALVTTLNYTITAYLSDLIACSDRMSFQVNVAECTHAPIKPSIFKDVLIFIFIYSFSLMFIYITYLAYNSFL